jgi:ubiquinone/menaquinone biosynthesis C-methylase UbiE
MSNQSEGEGISLTGFTSSSHGSEFEAYIAALESFNRIEQLQELKKLGHERIGIGLGARGLEVGCGFGLETLRLARLVAPVHPGTQNGSVAGCDLSADFSG